MASLDPSTGTGPLQTAIADEFRRVGQLIEQLAEVLVADEAFVLRHIDRLQVFDLIVQCAHESAAVLDRLSAGVSAHDAIASVRLGTVQQRLTAALAKAA